jgi:hypothetical protein
MTLGLKSELKFGKYKGQIVEEVLKRDPAWMCWIRDEKRSQGQPRLWDDDVTARLDEMILASVSLRKKYKPSNQLGKPFDIQETMKKAVDADAARSKQETELSLAYAESWGAWS